MAEDLPGAVTYVGPKIPDGTDCPICFQQADDSHHITPRSQAPDRVDDPSNQIPLCRPCHDMVNGGGWSDSAEQTSDGAGIYRVADNETGELIAIRNVRLTRKYWVFDTYPAEALQIVASAEFLSIESLMRCHPDQLEYVFHESDRKAGKEFLRSCMAVEAFRRMSSPLDPQGWVDLAGQQFKRGRSSIYLYCQVWQLYEAARQEDSLSVYIDEIEKLSPGTWNVLTNEVPQDRRIEALEATVQVAADIGEAKPGKVRRALQEQGMARAYVYVWSCPSCSYAGDMNEFRVRAEEE